MNRLLDTIRDDLYGDDMDVPPLDPDTLRALLYLDERQTLDWMRWEDKQNNWLKKSTYQARLESCAQSMASHGPVMFAHRDSDAYAGLSLHNAPIQISTLPTYRQDGDTESGWNLSVTFYRNDGQQEVSKRRGNYHRGFDYALIDLKKNAPLWLINRIEKRITANREVVSELIAVMKMTGVWSPTVQMTSGHSGFGILVGSSVTYSSIVPTGQHVGLTRNGLGLAVTKLRSKLRPIAEEMIYRGLYNPAGKYEF